MLDLRLPTGGFFMLAGLILVAMGLVSPESRAALTDVNVNLICGLFMVAFGAIMLVLAWRSGRKPS
jgi:uncharacterized membrane protein HdeD (DUF308 family)